MSSPKIEIVNPLRFFSFFGLFSGFLFLAFKSCSNETTQTKYVDAGELKDAEESKKSNTEELSEFITDIKKDLKKNKPLKDKDLTDAELAVLEDKKLSNAKKKKVVKKKLARKTVKTKKKARPEKRASSLVKSKIIVKSLEGRLSPFSKLELKRTVGQAKNKSFSKIMIYGYHSLSQPKGKAFVKAAEIKNTLIGLGVKRSVPIYMLTEQTTLPDAMGKVVFSQ